jgi:hypothetical protein
MFRVNIDGDVFTTSTPTPTPTPTPAPAQRFSMRCVRSGARCRICAMTTGWYRTGRVPHVCGRQSRVKHVPWPVAAHRCVDGMVVHITTRSASLDALRQTNLSLLAAHYPGAAVDRRTRSIPFHQLLRDYRRDLPATMREADLFSDDSHPYLGVALDRCIHCQRCVRICDEVQGQSVWHSMGTRPIHAHRNERQAIRCSPAAASPVALA